ncbi:MAG: ATP-binding cassette domain-containing protein, partial [Phycisphaerae bacterium]|nr:ATP-binding cassette domain-containing protein [Phycisphaerae bacterium]
DKRLGISSLQSTVRVPGAAPQVAVQIVHVEDGKPAARAGLKTRQWIVGLAAKAGASPPTATSAAPGETNLARTIAFAPTDQPVVLGIYDQLTQQVTSVQVTLPPPPAAYGALRDLFGRIPEPHDQAERLPLFQWLLGVVLVLTIIRATFTFIQEYLIGTAIWQGIMDLRCENYDTVLRLPTTFFSEKGVSDATSRFIQDTNVLARGQNTLLGKTLVEPAKAIGSLVLALTMSWPLTLMALVSGPPAFLLIRKFGKKMHRASRRSLESWSSMLAVLGETLQGIRVVKAYTMEAAERLRFFRVNRALLKQQRRMERLDAAGGPTVEAMGMVAGMLAAAAAGYLVFVGLGLGDFFYRMDRDQFLTWMVALFAMFDPVRKLAKVSMRFQEAEAAAQRIFELRDIPHEPHVVDAPALARHRQSIEFRNVSFRYPSAAEDAVKHADFHIRAGQTVAIVGPNGSGKTTLVSLVPRLLTPASGQVLIDGVDIAGVSLKSLRSQIGLVTQDTVMFHATIGENIAYGKRRARREEVLAAAARAFVDEFVRQLPDGYDTMVGEHGATLSGGQKQRISIARAILRDPAILIFDEAMSQVDAESENRIHQALAEFAKGRTTLLVAHRFATVLAADHIVVMNAGAIIDSGTHGELLGRCELYRNLYQTQFIDTGGQAP